MGLQLIRAALADDGIRRAPSDNEMQVLRFEAALELHEIGHRLWAEGERKIAVDCLRVAARYELPEAETDLLVWRATKGRGISDCAGVPLSDVDPAEIWGVRRVFRLTNPASMLPAWPKLAAGLLAIGVIVAALFSYRLPTGTDRIAALPSMSPRTSLGQNATILPPADARFTPAPSPTGSRIPSWRPQAPPARPEFRVELDSGSNLDYVVTLHSAAGKQPCRWNIVGTAPRGSKRAAQVDLEPGELQEVTVPARQWSSLSVFPDIPGECTVVGGKRVAVQRPLTVGPPVPASGAASASATPAPTEATVMPATAASPGPLPSASRTLPPPSPARSP
jgi:hypothetical protein